MINPDQLDRRSLLERMLLLAGASAAAGFSTAALAKGTGQARPAFSPARSVLLNAVADTIVPRTDTPGAIDAGVPATLDKLLVNWGSPKRRVELGEALDRIDAMAKAQTGEGFVALAPAKRLELLLVHDAAAMKSVPRTDGATGIAAMLAGPSLADPGYGKLKELIVVLYYYSETALTHELPYEHAPGQWQPSIPVTADTRPYGGLGLF
jgi:gluconate 2-dehydrogenase gamma chain